MSPTTIFAVDFRRVAEAGLRTKQPPVFLLSYLAYATDPSLATSAFVRRHGKDHPDGRYLPLLSSQTRTWLKAVRFTQQPHVRVNGAEVACGIRVDALGRMSLLTSDLLECGPSIVPTYFNFTFGSCVGCIKPGATAYELLAVQNTQPNNGDFARLMEYLVDLARYHERDLIVLEVENERLDNHLREHWQMQRVGQTKHLFRRIAGSGNCPEEFRIPASANPGFDIFFKLILNSLAA